MTQHSAPNTFPFRLEVQIDTPSFSKALVHVPRQDPDVQSLKSFALDDAPVFVTVGEQVATVEADRLRVEGDLLGRRFGLLRKLASTFELGHVEPHRASRVEPNVLGRDAKIAAFIVRSIWRLQDAIDPPQRGVQGVASAFFRRVSPENAGQVFAGMRRLAIEGQIREQLAGFAARETRQRPAAAFELE